MFLRVVAYVAVAGTKKKPNTGAENIRPLRSAIDGVSVPAPGLGTPPSSPSKRRQAASHYCDVECSPSKKRGTGVVSVAFEERGLLFGDSTNVGGNMDLDVEVVKLRSQTAKVKVEGPKKRMGKKT